MLPLQSTIRAAIALGNSVPRLAARSAPVILASPATEVRQLERDGDVAAIALAAESAGG